MSERKRGLVVTDGTESIQLIARSIANELSLFDVKTRTADEYKGTDLLPAEVFFIGCENPNPASFNYLSHMLSHINLAGRKCGIFSTNKKALKYLADLIKDSEAFVGKPLFITDAKNHADNVKAWLKEKSITGQ